MTDKTCPTCGRPDPGPIEECEECNRMAKTTWIGEPPKCPKHSHLGTTFYSARSAEEHVKYEQPCLTKQVCDEDKKRGGPGIALVSCPCPKCTPRF